MAQTKLFSAVFTFLALIFILEIQTVEGSHLKFDSKKLNTFKRFLTKETTKVVEGRSRLHATDNIEAINADVQNPSTAPLTPGAEVEASQASPLSHVDDFRPATPGHSPGVGHSIQTSPGHLKFDSKKLNTHKRFLGKETVEVVEDRSSSADVQTPPAAPWTPGAEVGASQSPPPRHVNVFRPTAPGHSPGVGHSIQTPSTHLKFDSKKLNTYKRFSAKETAEVVAGRSRWHGADNIEVPNAPVLSTTLLRS